MRSILVLLAAVLLLGQPLPGISRALERSEILYVAAPDSSGRELRVRLVLPEGNGPFPLALINHGSPRTAEERQAYNDPQYRELERWFLDRGYAVALPLRRGYGDAGGEWSETFVSCDNPDYVKAGLESAKDIEAALAALYERDDVSSAATIAVGQSAGGWAVLALASLNVEGVRGYVNFSGGRGGHIDDRAELNCNSDALVEAAGRYGETSREPTLWLYSENDAFFPPSLAERMQEAFTNAGGAAEFMMLPPVGDDGHMLASEGEEVWSAILDTFLEGKGLDE
ncbi:MAG: Dipeptidyl aminopeptidase/acylaminoacyl-peptidase-like protein [Rhizobium sp.]|nr:Dipeptidyl aminopeptidase/acylaminoacyl-peptidase-like protein [Rhizobium sp.]